MTSYTNGVLETPAESADGIEINYDPRPRVRITNIAIIDAVSVPGRHTRSLDQDQPPGAIYHDLLLANTPHNQSLSAAIQKIRDALDRELDMMKTTNDTSEHYWMEMIYRHFLGSFRIHHVGGSVLPEAEDTGSIEATLGGISIQHRGFLLTFRSYDERFSLLAAVTVEDIQHLHRRGVIFLRNHGEISGSSGNISMLLESNGTRAPLTA
ncbi:hypothetical protein PAAG_08750 [Paracoccidioides lutzii Pb01]|uniref:Uncharacterized protein n=1 Tax=Paracoccidioides lutzii (strain ATCC MYA-826 / Pb01) TaxID=502779 RepID=C1HDA9_PARBA|nr:hypothetical protein PAAG_08750 [Paracoccidioides lutzii Pb01]EEH39481.1 hypothetical protein PAAG_08750 [Paracoccidioides lutzii Pb01]